MTEPPRTTRRDDLIATLTGGALMLGLFLDGWNHLNLQNGRAGGFFTPWHGLLYAGFNACAIWAITRNPRLRAMLPALPAPRRRQLLAPALAFAAGVLATMVAFGALAGQRTGDRAAAQIVPVQQVVTSGPVDLRR
jgi:hypothetical protein